MAFQTPPIEVVRTLVDDEIKRQIKDLEDRVNAQIDDSATRIINALGGPRTIWEQDQRNKLYAQIDGLTRAKVGMDYAHHEIHAGSSYAVQNYANSTQVAIAFRTPPIRKQAHVVWEISAESDCYIEVFVDRTWTTGTGTVVVPKNQNDNYPDESMLQEDNTATPAWTSGGVLQDPTGLAGGTRRSIIYSFGGKFGSDNAGIRHEHVLKPNTTYSFELNSMGVAQNMQVRLYWYEHTPSL